MNIRLKNIGIIKNSNIQLDGLTVITGQNNSGKTTVGKVIYSLVDAVSNLSAKAENDRLMYISDVLKDIRDSFEIFRLTRRVYDNNEPSIFSRYPAINYLLNRFNASSIKLISFDEYENIEEFSRTLRDELITFDINLLDEHPTFLKYYRRLSVISEDIKIKDAKNKIKNQFEKAVSILDKMFKDIDRDSELIDYARESINQTLRVEFSKQIQPVKFNVKNSRIEVFDNDAIIFAFNIVDNKLVNDGNPVFSNISYKKAYFIDNPFVLDSLPYRKILATHDLENNNTILNARRILPHEVKLNYTLKGTKITTVFEETVINHGLTEIKEKINEVISGEFEFNSDGEFYIKDGKKLHLTNLATGSKMFSILKILLDKGEIDESTLLVLDEPEAHLHPNWQNKFAEIIVLLIKYLNTNILLTSHSPNFVLAIDAYMRKYNIIDKTNFYQTKHLQDDSVEYINYNDDLGQIYADFMQYLSEVKALRNFYYHNLGENDDN